MNYSSNLSVPLLNGALNFAPLKPLLSLKDTPQPNNSYLGDALKERLAHYRAQDKEAWRQVLAAGQQNALFAEGKQLLKRDAFTGLYRPMKLQDGGNDTKRVQNMTRFMLSNLIAKDVGAQPRIRAIPEGDSDEARSSAKAANAVIDYLAGKFFTKWRDELIAISKICFGTYVLRTYHDPQKAGKDALFGLREIIEEKETQIWPGMGECAECRASGTHEEFAPGDEWHTARCPSCGSDAVNLMSPETEILPQITGRERVSLGELCCTLLDLPSCRWDMKHAAHESSWFLHEQFVPLTQLRGILGPRVRIDGDSDAPNDGNKAFDGLKILESLAASGAVLDGRENAGTTETGQDRSSSLWKAKARLSALWLSPEDYDDLTCKGLNETVSGQGIEEDTEFVQVFPDGVCAVFVNNTHLLGLFGESHKKQVKSGIWHINAASGLGQGMNDVIEAQKQRNAFASQTMQYIGGNATPGVMYLQELLTPDAVNLLRRPDARIPISGTLLPDGIKPQEAVFPMPVGQLNPAILQYLENFNESAMQRSAHVTQFSDGVPGGGNKDTATAAQITQANSDAVLQGPFTNKGEVRRGVIEDGLELFKTKVPLEVWLRTRSKYGRQTGIQISGKDLSGPVSLEVVEGSDLSRDEFSKRNAYAMYLQVVGSAGGFEVLQATRPQLLPLLEGAFGINTPGEDSEELETLCLERLASLKPIVGQAEQGGYLNPDECAMVLRQLMPFQALPPGLQQVIAAQPFPPSVFELNHEDKAKWFAGWLDTNDGLDASVCLRAAAAGMIILHAEFGSGQAGALGAMQGQAEMAAQQPMMDARLQQQEAQAGQQQEGEARKMAMQQQQSEAQMEAQAQEAAAGRQHEREMADNQAAEAEMTRQQQMQLETAKMAQTAQLAKSRGRA